MATIFRVRDVFNATLVDLNSDSNASTTSGTTLLRGGYTPRAPQPRMVSVPNAGDGSRVTRVTYENVQETATIRVQGSSKTDLHNKVRAINMMLGRARRWTAYPQSLPIFLEYQPDGAPQLKRSPLYGGMAELVESTFRDMYKAVRADVRITWTRGYYWEYTSWVDVELGNDNTWLAGTGLAVYNMDTATANVDNWVYINGADIAGDLPTPIKLRFVNTYNDAAGVRRIHVGYNVNSYPLDFVDTQGHFYDSGSKFTDIASASTQAAASDVGGDRKRYSWSGSSETALFKIVLDDGYTPYLNFQRFRLLMRVVGMSYSDLSIRWKVKPQASFSSDDLYVGEQVLLVDDDQLADTGTVPLPPKLIDYNTIMTDLELHCYAQRAAGGSCTLDVDWVMLMPLDGYRVYEPAGTHYLEYATLRELMDSPGEGMLWTGDGWADTNAISDYVARGEPIMIYPNEDAVLVFAWDSEDQLALPARTATVQVQIRPRTLLI